MTFDAVSEIAASTSELLRDGTSAFRNGDVAQARILLAQLVAQDAANVEGWLWLSRAADTDRLRDWCLGQAVALDLDPGKAIPGLLSRLDPQSVQALASIERGGKIAAQARAQLTQTSAAGPEPAKTPAPSIDQDPPAPEPNMSMEPEVDLELPTAQVAPLLDLEPEMGLTLFPAEAAVSVDQEPGVDLDLILAEPAILPDHEPRGGTEMSATEPSCRPSATSRKHQVTAQAAMATADSSTPPSTVESEAVEGEPDAGPQKATDVEAEETDAAVQAEFAASPADADLAMPTESDLELTLAVFDSEPEPEAGIELSPAMLQGILGPVEGSTPTSDREISPAEIEPDSVGTGAVSPAAPLAMEEPEIASTPELPTDALSPSTETLHPKQPIQSPSTAQETVRIEDQTATTHQGLLARLRPGASRDTSSLEMEPADQQTQAKTRDRVERDGVEPRRGLLSGLLRSREQDQSGESESEQRGKEVSIEASVAQQPRETGAGAEPAARSHEHQEPVAPKMSEEAKAGAGSGDVEAPTTQPLEKPRRGLLSRLRQARAQETSADRGGRSESPSERFPEAPPGLLDSNTEADEGTASARPRRERAPRPTRESRAGMPVPALATASAGRATPALPVRVSTVVDVVPAAAPPASQRLMQAFFKPPLWARSLLYLVGVAVAELLVTYSDPRVGLAFHCVLLAIFIIDSSRSRELKDRDFMITMAFAPLIRILSLSLPLTHFETQYWYLLTSIPLFVAIVLTSRALSFEWREFGLTLRGLPVQILVSLTGFGFGVVEYYILQPAPLAPALRFVYAWWPALILVVSTGLLEELIFRGLLQRTGEDVLGRWGMPYVALLFAVLHIGYRSLPDVVFVLVVGLFLGWVVQRTRSLVGVTLAHGLTNTVLFLIMPFLVGG